MFPSRSNIKSYEPFRFTITDDFGETLLLSRSNPHKGEVLQLEVEVNDAGLVERVTASGFFHDDERQNRINDLQRLRGMQTVSEQLRQELLFLCPHPEISFRGYMTSLKAPGWNSQTPGFFEFAFDITRSPRPRQTDHFRSSREILPSQFQAERPYVLVTVPADFTTLRDLMYEYRGRRLVDGRAIREAIRLNLMDPDHAENLIPGEELKLPPF